MSIYKITCNITGNVYIGSSLQKGEKRLLSHKCPSNGCLSKSIIDGGNYTFQVLESFTDIDRDELRKKEQEYINNNICINKYRAYRTEEEKRADNLKSSNNYFLKNPDKVRKNSKDRYERLKDDINAKMREKQECKCGLMCSKRNMLRHLKSKRHTNYINTNGNI